MRKLRAPHTPEALWHAVDPKAWHTQSAVNDVWVPNVWNKRLNIQPCDGLCGYAVQHMAALHDRHMVSPDVSVTTASYPEPLSRRLLAQWANKTSDKIDGKVVG